MVLDQKTFCFSSKLAGHHFIAKEGIAENIFIAYSMHVAKLVRSLVHTKFNTVLMNFIKS
jgi:hypothetical protein